MDPIVIKGRFWWIRVAIGWVLILVYVGLPHITINGKPGIFLDMTNRQFTFFGLTFQPTDNVILLSMGATIIVSTFALTALFGRLWCGFGCPHPIYLEFLYRPIESFLEGKPAVRRRRDAGPWTLDKAWRKAAKWAIYVAIGVVLGATFVSYFVGWDTLVDHLANDLSVHKGELAVIALITVATFVDFSYFRDQLCTVACPWGRLQTALYDQDTIIVGYDARRGEPRTRKPKPGEEAGDCVDCGRCVATCPTGVDIRRGLQMECIGCAQCIEACDEVMLKLNKPIGLVRYTSLRDLGSGEKRFVRPRLFIYAGLLTLTIGAFIGLNLTRAEAKAEILRTGREPYRLLPTGQIANLLRVRLTNQRDTPQAITIELSEPQSAELVVSQSPFSVEPNRVATVDIVVKVKDTKIFVRGKAEGIFIIRSDADFESKEEFLLLGPYS
jgi:cytochrome c oxidase accessory protein FixG